MGPDLIYEGNEGQVSQGPWLQGDTLFIPTVVKITGTEIKLLLCNIVGVAFSLCFNDESILTVKLNQNILKQNSII